MTIFETLNGVNVNGHTEKKNGLTYLSWAWAWAELLKRYPDSTYTVYENKDGWCYHTDGRTAWVKTGVTVEGKEYIEMLPVMDFKNKSIPLDNITSMDVNKAIQRSLTKAVARHGLGLYIYAGEDLPEGEEAKLPEDAMKPGEKLKPEWNVRTGREKFCKSEKISGADVESIRRTLVQRKKLEDKKLDELTPIDFDNVCKAVKDALPEYRSFLESMKAS